MASYEDLDALLEELTQAAIDADMHARGFGWQEGDHYQDPMRHRHVYRGDPGRNDMGASDETTDYEAEVFRKWPADIEEIFAAWRADVLPDPAAFRSQVDALTDCARPIGLPSLIEPPPVLRRAGRGVGGDGPMADLVERVRRGTGPLEGGWIDAFHSEWVVPLPYVLGNQGAMLELLATSVDAEAQMWHQVRQDVADLAESGAQWFRRSMHGGHAFDLVVEVAKAMGTVFRLRRGGNPLKVAKGVGDLIGQVQEIGELLEANRPPDPTEIPTDVASIRTLIAQRLEYTINGQIKDAEDALDGVLRNAVTAMRTSRGTFALGDADLDRVAGAAEVLVPQQRLTERAVDQVVGSMFRLGDQVTSAAGGIVTSVYPFVRPASIGIGSRGPYDSVLDLENEIHHAMHDTAHALEKAATVVRICADYAFAGDGESASVLCAVDDRLDRALEGLDDHVRPPGRGVSPYEPPDVSVHVEVPDCLPDVEDPFADAPRGPLAPPVAP